MWATCETASLSARIRATRRRYDEAGGRWSVGVIVDGQKLETLLNMGNKKKGHAKRILIAFGTVYDTVNASYLM